LVKQVLQNFTKFDDWQISRIGAGEQSVVFIAVPEELKNTPFRSEHRQLIVKLYKTAAGLSLERVQAQSSSLSKLHLILDGREFKGWTFSVPRPICVCPSPLAFVMTAVPGQHLDGYRS